MNNMFAALIKVPFAHYNNLVLPVDMSLLHPIMYHILPSRDYIVELGMAYIRFARENPEQFQFLFDNQTVAADEPARCQAAQ
jgi:hypothetical protein